MLIKGESPGKEKNGVEAKVSPTLIGGRLAPGSTFKHYLLIRQSGTVH